MVKKTGILVSILFFLATLLSVYFYFSAQNQTIYSDEMITSVSTGFKSSLKTFLSMADNSANEIRVSTVSNNNDTLTYDELNKFFTKQIKKDKLLKGIILTGKNLDYLVIQDKKTWATTYSYSNSDTMLNWNRLDDNLNIISQWSDTYNFFMNGRNKGIIIKEVDLDGESVWRKAQSELPEYRDMLINVIKIKDKGGETYLIGLVYKISEITGNFASIFEFENPLINIVMKSGEIITPLSTADTSKISYYRSLSNETQRLLNNWSDNRNNEPYSYSFDISSQVYWTRIDTLNNYGLKAFIVTVSQKDIILSYEKVQNRKLYIASVFFVIGLIIISFSLFRKRKSETVIKSLEQHSDATVIDLISKGETEYVEFKSSLRYDYRQQKENKILEDVILKSISAFANAKGGTLFIGVDDDLNILGLDNDFGTLKKNDADYFELHLRKLINNQYGINFSSESLLIYFPIIEGKIICVIQINPASSALYLKTKDKQGQMTEKFYVRIGNASEQISSLREINDYIKRRFKRRF